jgi:hypothetical protein
MGMSAEENWEILQCDGAGIGPSMVSMDLDGGVLEVSFGGK